MITKHQIRRLILIVTVLVLASTLLHALLQRQIVGVGTAVRLMGMLEGLIILACANDIPKQLVPLARLHCDPARDQALRRVVGWAMALGGVAYTLAYALAPVAIAPMLAILLLTPSLAVLAYVLVRCARARWRARVSAA